MNTQIGQTARLPFPQISLQRALEETLKVYAAFPDARLLSERRFRQLLGSETTNGTLLRLTSTLQQYGLVAADGYSPALTSLAQELYSADDQPRFFSLLQAAANCPELARELSYDDAAELQPEKIERRLIALALDSRSRRAIMGVLLENESFLMVEKASGTLFHRVQAMRESQPRPGVSTGTAFTGTAGAKGGLKVLPGRAASLTLVALFVTGGLIYAMSNLVRPGSTAGTHPIPSTVAEVGRSSAPVTAAPPELRALANNQTSNQASRSTPPGASPRSVDDGKLAPVKPPVTAIPRMAQQPPTHTPLARGRKLAQLLFTQHLDSVWKAFSPSVQQEWSDFPSFVEYRKGGLAMFGNELKVLSEGVRLSGGVNYYTRTAIFERRPQKPWTVIFGLDRSGKVVAFNIVAANVLPSTLETVTR